MKSSFRNQRVSNEWPPENLLQSDCWHCCHPFEGFPHPLPTAFDERLNLFTLRGCFCSWECVKGYIQEMGGSRQSEQFSLVAFLLRRVYGTVTRSSQHPVAPTRQQLRKFGGVLTIDEFRRHAKPADLKRNMLPNIFNKDVPINDYIILHDNAPRRSTKIKQTGEAEEEPFRIKRSKPERRHSNTLSRLMKTATNSEP